MCYLKQPACLVILCVLLALTCYWISNGKSKYWVSESGNGLQYKYFYLTMNDPVRTVYSIVGASRIQNYKAHKICS